jgi:hypothetical protein
MPRRGRADDDRGAAPDGWVSQSIKRHVVISEHDLGVVLVCYSADLAEAPSVIRESRKALVPRVAGVRVHDAQRRFLACLSCSESAAIVMSAAIVDHRILARHHGDAWNHAPVVEALGDADRTEKGIPCADRANFLVGKAPEK